MNLQEKLTPLLLRNIEIEKLGIRGKLVNLLFTTENNGFGVELTIHSDDRNRNVKLPAPFGIEVHEDNLLYFDYRLSTIFNHARWKPLIREFEKKSQELGTTNKFFNSIIEIVIV